MSTSKKTDWKKVISIIVLVSFIAPIGFLTYKICTTSNQVLPSNLEGRVRSDYVLMLMQCIIGIIALWLPSIMTQKLKWEIPNKMYYFYLIFLYGAIFLGEIRNFYYRFKYWDLILHTFSGTMIGFFGFSVVDILNNETKNVKLNAFLVAFFAFCFAMTLGGIWEIYEFVSDGILNTNMQKFALQSGVNLSGREALTDTMEDLIVDGIGALAASTLGYISLKYDKQFLNNVLIKINKNKKNLEEKIEGGTDKTAHLK